MSYYNHKPSNPETSKWLEDQKTKAKNGDLTASQELLHYYCFQDRSYVEGFKYGKQIPLGGGKINYFK